MGIEQALVVLSSLLFVFQIFAWRWARSLQKSLRGYPGYELARILALIIGWTLIISFFGVGSTVLINRDDLDAALWLAFVTQLMGAALFVWAAFSIWRLNRNNDDLGDDVEGHRQKTVTS